MHIDMLVFIIKSNASHCETESMSRFITYATDLEPVTVSHCLCMGKMPGSITGRSPKM